MLNDEFDYYIANQECLVKKYNGRYLIIKDQKVVGDFETFAKAVSEGQSKYQKGTFIVQRCSKGIQDYTFSYHSRVRF